LRGRLKTAGFASQAAASFATRKGLDLVLAERRTGRQLARDARRTPVRTGVRAERPAGSESSHEMQARDRGLRMQRQAPLLRKGRLPTLQRRIKT